jgi:hypothetical protein
VSRTNEIIYEMLTESTGEHMLDSGQDDGRHWQINQKKSLKDFENEPRLILLDQDRNYPYYEKSTFHHLADSCIYLPNENADLFEWVSQNEYDYFKNENGRSLNSMYDIEDYMLETYNLEPRVINTFNEECSLTQTLQFITLGDTYDSNIIALSVHNGADVRGGYTDYKIFEIETDLFYSWYLEYDEENHFDLVANI